MIPWFVWIVPAIFVLLGGAFALVAVSTRRQGRICAQWPVAAGRILQSHEVVRLVEVEDDRHDRGPRHRDEEFFGANLSYTYEVDGREYRSTRIYPGRPVLDGNPKSAAAIIAKYPAGALVSVFYNPANPAQAVLEPLNSIYAKVALLAGAGFGGLGLLAIFLLSQTSMT
jgi:hypothetical protein